MQPYRIALTGLVRAGENRLETRVTNLLLNFVAGLDQPPGVPPELASRYGVADRSHAPSRILFEKEKAFRPLPPGGLLGPVSLLSTRIR